MATKKNWNSKELEKFKNDFCKLKPSSEKRFRKSYKKIIPKYLPKRINHGENADPVKALTRERELIYNKYEDKISMALRTLDYIKRLHVNGKIRFDQRAYNVLLDTILFLEDSSRVYPRVY